MKNYLFIIILSIFVISCTEPEPEPEPQPNPTRLIIRNNLPYIGEYPEINGTLYQTYVLIFNGDDLVGSNYVGTILYGGGSSGYINLPDYAEKVKLRFTVRPAESTLDNPTLITGQYYMISKNIDNQIIIDENTLISSKKKTDFLNHFLKEK